MDRKEKPDLGGSAVRLIDGPSHWQYDRLQQDQIADMERRNRRGAVAQPLIATPLRRHMAPPAQQHGHQAIIVYRGGRVSPCATHLIAA